MNDEHHLVPVEHRELMEPQTQGPASAPPAEPDPLKKLHSILRGRYKWAIGLGLVLAIIGALAGFLIPTPAYTSTGVIQVKPVTMQVLTNTGDKELPMYEAYVNSQVALMQSQRVIQELLKQDGWRRLGRGNGPDALSELMENLSVNHLPRSQLILVSYEDPDKEAAQQIVDSLMAAYMKIVESSNRDERLVILSSLRERLLADQRRLSQLRIDRSSKWGTDDLSSIYQIRLQETNRLESQLREMELALRAAEEAMGKTGEAPAGPGAEGQPGNAQAANGEGNAAAPAAAAAAPAMLQPEDLTIPLIAARDDKMAGLVAQRDALERQMNVDSARLGANHFEVKRQRALLSEIERGIEEYAAEFRNNYVPGAGGDGSLAGTIEQIRARYAAMKKMYEDAKRETIEIGKERLEIDGIKLEEDQVAMRLNEVEARIEALQVESNVDTRVSILSQADEPLRPSRDRRKLATAAGVVFGGGFGFGIIFLIGLLDRRLRSYHDAQDNFSIPMLGILPRLPQDLADPEQAAIASHCVHQVRTLLQVGPSAQGRRCFAITSPGVEDGKTSLALALGVSFAASGAKTLMIDADMFGGSEGLTGRVNAILRRKIGQILQRAQLVTEQQVEQALRVAQESNRKLGETLIDLGYLDQQQLDEALTLQEQIPVGLLDALDGEPIEHCVAETGIDQLSVLPIGAANPDDVCKLSPAYIARLLDEARRLYDIVLVDTGPVPMSLEASHVAAEADAVVLVVSRGEQRNAAEKAIDHLNAIGARLSGLVFNRAEGRDIESLGEESGDEPTSRRARVTVGASEESSRFGPVARAVASSSKGRNGTNGSSSR